MSEPVVWKLRSAGPVYSEELMALFGSCVFAIPRAIPLIPPPGDPGPRLSMPGVTVRCSRSRE